MTVAVTLTAHTRLDSLPMTELEQLPREALEAYAYELQTRIQYLVRQIEHAGEYLEPYEPKEHGPDSPVYHAAKVGGLDGRREIVRRQLITALSLIETFTGRDAADARAELEATARFDDEEQSQ